MAKIKCIIAVFIVFAVCACSNNDKVPVVKLGHAPHDHHSPLYIAAVKQEYFNDKIGVYFKEVQYKKEYLLYKDEKLLARVEIDSGTGGINLIRKLDEKLIDISFGGVPAVINMIDQGSSIKIIAPVMSEGAALVMDTKYPVNNWKDFVDFAKDRSEPVRIGYKVSKSVQNLIFESALRVEGLTFSKDITAEDVDIIVINLHGPKNLIPSLEAQVIDGFVVMQPYPALAEYSRDGKIVANLSSLPPKGSWVDHPCCALAAHSEFLQKDQRIIEALITLFQSSGEYIKSNPDESAGIVSEWLGTPKSVERVSLPTISFLSEYTKEWDRGVNIWIESLIKGGHLNGKVRNAYENSDVKNLIYDNTIYNRVIAKNKQKDVDK